MRPMISSSILLLAFLAACTSDDKPVGDTVGGTDSDSTGGVDADGDGYDTNSDCDDNDATVNPAADEECDGVDNNCDGEIDEGVTSPYYEDADGDGFGDDASAIDACEATDGWVATNGDCDDADPYVYPAAEELCDGIDNDCDDIVDNDLDTSTYYADADGDSYGDADEPRDACEAPPGYVDNDIDCDDTDSGEPVHADAETGSAAGSGSMANPLDSLQDAIDMANVCVFAMPGTFNEDIDFGGKDIIVMGVDGAENTFIEGTGDSSVVTFASGESSGAVLTGFTIMGGSGTVETTVETDGSSCSSTITTTTYRYYGGGLYVDGASPTLYDLIVTDNSLPAYSYSNPDASTFNYVYSYGGGAFIGDATPDTWNIIFASNYADNGGGLYVNSSSTVDGTWFVVDGNSASGGGGITTAGETTLANSVVVNNTATESGGSTGGAGVNIIDGTTWLNYTTAWGNDGSSSVYVDTGSGLGLWNSILGSNNDGYVVNGNTGASLSASYSDVYGGYSGEYGSVFTDPTGSDGNVSSNPLFTTFSDDGDYSNDDLTLSAGSPCEDAGDPAESDADGTAADMGAYGGADGSW